MSFIISIILFLIFAVNVAIGSMGGVIILGDVGEMLLLFAASIFFVAAILKKEATRDENNGGN